MVGLWRGEGCCWHSWEDMGITAPSGHSRYLLTVAACEELSSLLRAAWGAARDVLSPPSLGRPSPSWQLLPCTSPLFLWAHKVRYLLQP